MADSSNNFDYYWNYLFQFQYFIFIAVAAFRINKYWHHGQFNPRFVPRSKSYAFKVFCQLALSILNFTFVFELKENFIDVEVDSIDLIYAGYGIVWIFSIYLQFFEYKRGLPHECYSHLMFWGLNFISQTVILSLILTNKDKVLQHPNDHAAVMQITVTLSLMAFFSLLLFIMGLLYKKEYRFNENRGRNYLPRGSKSRFGLLKSFNEVSNSYGSKESMVLMNSEGQQLGPLPKLTANVKNVMFLDAADDVDCEIYVYKDEKIHRKLRKTYKELMELE